MIRAPVLLVFAIAACRALRFAEARRAHGQVAVMLDPLHRVIPWRRGALSFHAFASDVDKLLEVLA